MVFKPFDTKPPIPSWAHTLCIIRKLWMDLHTGCVIQVGSNMVGKALIIMNIVIFVMWSSCLFYFRKLHLCFKYNPSQIQYLHSLSYHSLLFIDHKRPLRDVGQEHKGTYYREINDVFVNVLHTRSTKEPTPRPSSSSSYSINRKTSF